MASRDIGMETAVQDVLNVTTYNNIEDFVLVGHSFAGKVAAAVADRIPNGVKLVVYLDAFRPEKVRTPQGAFNPVMEFGPPPEGGFAIPFTEKILDSIGKDVQGADRAWFLSKVTPWPVRPANEPVTLSARFDSVKSAYIFCTGSGDPVDEIISGKWGKLEGPYRVIESGHWPMITKPDELVDDMLLLTAEA